MTTLNVDNARPEEWLNAYDDNSKQVGCIWNGELDQSNCKDQFNDNWKLWVNNVNCATGQSGAYYKEKSSGDKMLCKGSRRSATQDATLCVRPDKVSCPDISGTTRAELSKSNILTTNMNKMNSGLCPMAPEKSSDDTMKTLEPILNCTYNFNNTPGSQTPNETMYEFIKMAGWSTEGDNYLHPQNNLPYLTDANKNVLDDYMTMFCFSDDLKNDRKPRCLNTTDGDIGIPSSAQLCEMWRKSRSPAWDEGAENYCHSQVNNTEQPSYCRCLNLAVEGSDDYNSYLSIKDSNYTGQPKCWFTPCQSSFIAGGAEQILTNDLYENKCTSEGPSCVQINQITDATFNDFNNESSMNCTNENGESNVETTDTPNSTLSNNNNNNVSNSTAVILASVIGGIVLVLIIGIVIFIILRK